MPDFKTVLITGTHSGIGRGLLEHYHASGSHVICIDRRSDPKAIQQFPRAEFKTLAIHDFPSILALFRELERLNKVPSLVVLNAGINLVDNIPSAFDFEKFENVMKTNLMGAMTFVGAARLLNLKGIVFLGISSASNIVANPGHVGYHISKLGLHRAFRLLSAQDRGNQYKSVILGPIRTNISREFSGPTGFQKNIFEFLAKDVDQVSPKLARYAAGSSTVLYYPLGACLFYFFVSLLLKVVPSLYKGTQSN